MILFFLFFPESRVKKSQSVRAILEKNSGLYFQNLINKKGVWSNQQKRKRGVSSDFPKTCPTSRTAHERSSDRCPRFRTGAFFWPMSKV